MLETRSRFSFFAVLALCLSLTACSSPVPNRNPIGERFPAVTGSSLEGVDIYLPSGLGTGPVILLVGYEMDAQFDLDRWILGLLQLETPARLFEVPTIRGMIPGAFSGKIDDGMRSGIPDEDWGSVVTIYKGDAAKVVEFTGNEDGRRGRVLLLDSNGVVRWFQDRGYSGGLAVQLDEAARALVGK